MEKILTKKSFPKWAEKLNAYEIYAPILNDSTWSYEVIKKPENIDLDFPNTVQAPKKIINPQREVFLEFGRSDEDTLEIKEVLPEEKPVVIFGVRPCDAKALVLTDMVFDGDFKDMYYLKRRNQTVIIGLACNTPPSPNCFCTSVGGSPHSEEGFDILMTDLGDRYFVQSLTKKGDTLIDLGKALFTTPKATDKKELTKIHTDAENKLKREIKDVAKIPPKLKEMFESPLWDDESMSCLRCGICTYLCPTCHCFDISDEVTSVAPYKGYRIRTWDNCQFPDFTMHSSGHNPRPDKASRLRQRIMHKYQYFVERYDHYQCTGCGRCVSKCPVGIDIIEVLNKVRDYG
jgi:sulfhydrogenase subunit beta (sulfur reductase)